MKHPIVLGMQFGDEGKGKITDVLAKQSDWVIRFNGGNNAGHTLWLGGKKLVTHSVPSGVRYPHAKNFIGAGCVLDPVAFTKELQELEEAGAALSPERLKIDFRVHLTLPVHLALDGARESSSEGIGSTKRGIGPTYMSKMDRIGIRANDVFEKNIADRVKILCDHLNPILVAQGVAESSVEANLEVVMNARELLRRYLSTELTPFNRLVAKERCVLEGAQGVLLDLDHGTYPFVTSSSILPAYAAVGTPFPFRSLGEVIGVVKAYLTRVGLGPFESEFEDENAERLREKGGEYGATTGRPRRMGWLNLDELKTAVDLSGCTALVLSKADILTGEAQVKAWSEGAWKNFEGWESMLSGDKLNSNLETFVAEVEKRAGAPVVAVGTGPDRGDLFWRHERKDFWADVS